jgi:hypothetical protein
VTRTDSSSTPSAFVLSNCSLAVATSPSVPSAAGPLPPEPLAWRVPFGVASRNALTPSTPWFERLLAQRVLRGGDDLAVADGVGEERVDLLLVALLLDRLDALLGVGALRGLRLQLGELGGGDDERVAVHGVGLRLRILHGCQHGRLVRVLGQAKLGRERLERVAHVGLLLVRGGLAAVSGVLDVRQDSPERLDRFVRNVVAHLVEGCLDFCGEHGRHLLEVRTVRDRRRDDGLCLRQQPGLRVLLREARDGAEEAELAIADLLLRARSPLHGRPERRVLLRLAARRLLASQDDLRLAGEPARGARLAGRVAGVVAVDRDPARVLGDRGGERLEVVGRGDREVPRAVAVLLDGRDDLDPLGSVVGDLRVGEQDGAACVRVHRIDLLTAWLSQKLVESEV